MTICWRRLSQAWVSYTLDGRSAARHGCRVSRPDERLSGRGGQYSTCTGFREEIRIRFSWEAETAGGCRIRNRADSLRGRRAQGLVYFVMPT